MMKFGARESQVAGISHQTRSEQTRFRRLRAHLRGGNSYTAAPSALTVTVHVRARYEMICLTSLYNDDDWDDVDER